MPMISIVYNGKMFLCLHFKFLQTKKTVVPQSDLVTHGSFSYLEMSSESESPMGISLPMKALK